MAQEKLLRRQEVEDYCQLGRSSLYRLMRAGKFPLPIRVGERAVRWPEMLDDVERVVLIDTARRKSSKQVGKADINQTALALSKEFQGKVLYTPAKGWFFRSQSGYWLWNEDAEGLHMREWTTQWLADAHAAETVVRGFRATELVKAMEPLLAFEGPWDGAPELVGLPDGGILDLKTDMRLENPEMSRVSKRLGAIPAKEPSRLWIQTLEEIVGVEIADWLKVWAGYCLTGYIREHKFVLCTGGGRNGKSLIIEAITHVLGEYAKQLPPHALLERHTQHPEWLARLDGARFASAGDMPAGSWNLPLLKMLVAGTPVAAHFMRRGSFDLHPIVKIMMAANQKPSMRTVDVAIRERLVLIPFPRTFTEDEVDKKLPEKLKNEASGILTWALEGAQQYLKEGLPKVPDVAKVAAVNYLTSENQYAAWVDQCIKFDLNKFTPSTKLVESFTEFSGTQIKRATRLHEYLEQNHQLIICRQRVKPGTNPVNGIRGCAVVPYVS